MKNGQTVIKNKERLQKTLRVCLVLFLTGGIPGLLCVNIMGGFSIYNTLIALLCEAFFLVIFGIIRYWSD